MKFFINTIFYKIGNSQTLSLEFLLREKNQLNFLWERNL